MESSLKLLITINYTLKLTKPKQTVFSRGKEKFKKSKNQKAGTHQ